ncbi:hypothetical protein FACS189434_00570 [Bacteroidia bacterium]|nr:hypothetical protein FACS189434_00570 [Bacteroidia bacterium]
MYRFANKKYMLLREDGNWFYAKPDSLYQVTIMYPTHLDCGDTATINNDILNFMIEDYKMQRPSINIETKEIRNIQGKDFIVIGYKMEKKWNLDLNTEINGRLILIKFECQSENCTCFADKIEKSLNSIEIITNKTD